MARYDVVLFGATGFTGGLVAEYLARRGEQGWAIAGRSRDKLQRVRDRLGVDVPILVADSGDPESLAAMARQAKVLCTTVGPYARYGEGVVAACVAEGAHYCDLTGEPQFVRRMIHRHHAEARDKRLRVVHACGFDSVPSDLGCLVLQEAAVQRFGRPLTDVTLYVRKLRGGVSGGTIASMAAMMEQRDDPEVRRAVGDPYALVPGEQGPPVRDVRGLGRDRREHLWTAPFVMASANAKIVRRSAALLGWGEGFRYEEVSGFRGARGLLLAAGMTAGLGAFVTAMQVAPVRRLLLERVLPGPGEGPSPETRARGSFVMELVGRADAAELRVTVRGDRDPGYAGTSGMLAEAALCLARDPLPERYGVLTPASAMGRALVDRLPRAGITFAVAG